MSGLGSARQYGYSSARANAMKSKLLGDKTIGEVAAAKDVQSAVAILFEKEYKSDIEEFGGLKIKSDLMDFALSRNLARNFLKLVRLARGNDRKTMQAIVGKWDLYNVRLAIEAKSRKRPFESISKYLVNLGMHNASVIKEAMREESVEGMLSKLMINSPYKAMLSDAAEAYKKNRNSLESISALDKDYYLYLGSMAMALKNSKEGRETSYMLRMELDVRNILTMVRGKRASMKFGEIQGLLVGKGNISLASLEKMYSGSKDVDEMVSQLKSFDIMPAMERYRKDPHKQLITIEMGLRSSMLSKGMRMLGHKILSFGTILAYVYMKEYEISILRVLINGKAYGLDKEEAERLIGWKGK